MRSSWVSYFWPVLLPVPGILLYLRPLPPIPDVVGEGAELDRQHHLFIADGVSNSNIHRPDHTDQTDPQSSSVHDLGNMSDHTDHTDLQFSSGSRYLGEDRSLIPSTAAVVFARSVAITYTGQITQIRQIFSSVQDQRYSGAGIPLIPSTVVSGRSVTTYGGQITQIIQILSSAKDLDMSGNIRSLITLCSVCTA